IATVNLGFDTTGLGYAQNGITLSDYALMIDKDGDGDFNSGPIGFFNASRSAGSVIYFDGVYLPNAAVFTIVTLKRSLNLPAVWLGFSATASGVNALLQWKTAEEINVDYYLVEHSFNAVSYTAVGRVAANNTTGENNYAMTDYALSAGTHYYRIRRVDKDGKTALSSTRAVKIASNEANIKLWPNPATGATLLLSLSSQQPGSTSLQLRSADGKLLLQKSISLVTGNNQLTLDIAQLPAGIYLLQLPLNNDFITQKFIRQR
ncbi:MAG TPA: T9SS type A sorting domain-containing protein, partial [Chitinophagaceae bacterium]|nr:T9SS type A sorting domain-containing protein [Chitinophagaceae bacterium]